MCQEGNSDKGIQHAFNLYLLSMFEKMGHQSEQSWEFSSYTMGLIQDQHGLKPPS